MINVEFLEKEEIPFEVLQFCHRRRCPICRAKHEAFPTIIKDRTAFFGWSVCSKDMQHCATHFSYNTPKEIEIDSTEIIFLENDFVYRLQHSYENNNEVSIISIEEEYPETPGCYVFHTEIPGHIFNFKRFSKRKTLKQLKLLQTFT